MSAREILGEGDAVLALDKTIVSARGSETFICSFVEKKTDLYAKYETETSAAMHSVAKILEWRWRRRCEENRKELLL